jgi:hypothetical protein
MLLYSHGLALSRQICDFGLARIVHTSAMSSSGHGLEDEIDGKAPAPNFGSPPVRDFWRMSTQLDIVYRTLEC